MMGIKIEVQKVKKIYKKKKDSILALDNATLTIEQNKITALLGPNGSGKTTLIKSICGLVEIDEGDILINDKSIIKNKKLNFNIGCILEGERNIYYYLTVYDNLYYFGKLNKINRKELKERIDDILCKLNIDNKKYKYVSELSRGMQQKVALAILLIRNPDILLLDEPTLGLDVQSSLQLMEYLRFLSEKQGKTIILTTHQLELAEKISDNIILFENGKTLLQDTKENVLKKYQKSLLLKVTLNSITTENQELIKKYGEFNKDSLDIIVDTEQMKRLLDFCKNKNIEILNITSLNKNLQDIFLEIVGK